MSTVEQTASAQIQTIEEKILSPEEACLLSITNLLTEMEKMTVKQVSSILNALPVGSRRGKAISGMSLIVMSNDEAYQLALAAPEWFGSTAKTSSGSNSRAVKAKAFKA